MNLVRGHPRRFSSSYVNSKDGWSESEKRSEMSDTTSRYLIARDHTDPARPVGFLMFQFVQEETMDNDKVVEAAYWYVIISFCYRTATCHMCHDWPTFFLSRNLVRPLTNRFRSYELQLTPETRGKGLGTYLMKLLEDIGRHWHMEKVMLTVFRGNVTQYSVQFPTAFHDQNKCIAAIPSRP